MVVEFASGGRFVATFSTRKNLRLLMADYRTTGECAGGLYVWSTHTIIVERLTKANVDRVKGDLIASGEFVMAFAKIAE